MKSSIALLAIGALAVASPAAAQMKFGVLAGATMASLSTTNNTDYSLSSAVGFAGGISISREISGNLGFAPELLYVMKGAKETLKANSAVTARVKANYIEVPVLFRLMLGTGNMRPYLTAGPSIAFKASCKLTIAGASPSIDGTSDCNQDADPTSGIKSTDLGAMIGVGVSGARIAVSVRYDIGLGNITRDETVGAVTAKNRAFMGMISLTM